MSEIFPLITFISLPMNSIIQKVDIKIGWEVMLMYSTAENERNISSDHFY